MVAARAGNTVFFFFLGAANSRCAGEGLGLAQVGVCDAGRCQTACGSGTQARGTAEIGP